ncbi:MAG: non-hydrolyzing UDP-N-acetylglucosamine 2-epimerase [Cyclobacteriaceae bacterium]
MKIVTVLGARPQFVKAAPVSRALAKAGLHEVIVHTGQHYDPNMSDVFFSEMDIPAPHYNLDIHGGHHGAMTGRMLEKIESVLLTEKPDVVLVYGDTNSTLAGALAAAKLHVPVAHVEAGLRSFDMKMPEEVNRILTDRVSTYLFCPTSTAVANLQNEGYQNFPCRIEQCGDVMYDAVLHYRPKIAAKSKVMQQLGLKSGFVLATLHRAENTNDLNRLKSICAALAEIHREVPVVLPLHPRTQALVKANNIGLPVTVIDPVGYFDMLALLENCQLVLTDSGGLQKEAYFFQKFCITLRDQTEWTELVEAGVNRLAGADQSTIVNLFATVRNQPVSTTNPLYGDGHAAEKIAAVLKSGR